MARKYGLTGYSLHNATGDSRGGEPNLNGGGGGREDSKWVTLFLYDV